jgi:hypothetical protein
MSVEDFRINAYVRQVLSRCWVDSKTLRYGAVGRIVYFHGRFEKFRPPRRDDANGRSRQDEHAEDAALLARVEKEVRREGLVLDVVFRLENFRKAQGKWTATGV